MLRRAAGSHPVPLTSTGSAGTNRPAPPGPLSRRIPAGPYAERIRELVTRYPHIMEHGRLVRLPRPARFRTGFIPR